MEFSHGRNGCGPKITFSIAESAESSVTVSGDLKEYSGSGIVNRSITPILSRHFPGLIIQKFKKSRNSQRKPQHGTKERSDQRTLGKLMGANGTRGIYTMPSDFNSSNQDIICKTTFYRYYKKFEFEGSIVDIFLVLLPQQAF